MIKPEKIINASFIF